MVGTQIKNERQSPFGRVTKLFLGQIGNSASAYFWWRRLARDLPVASGAWLLPLERLPQPAGPHEGGAGPVLQAAQGDLLQEEVAPRLGKVAGGDRLRLAQDLVAGGADQPVQFAALHFAPQLRTENTHQKKMRESDWRWAMRLHFALITLCGVFLPLFNWERRPPFQTLFLHGDTGALCGRCGERVSALWACFFPSRHAMKSIYF